MSTKKLIEVDTLPKNGQFVITWVYKGKPWCQTMKYMYIEDEGETFLVRSIDNDEDDLWEEDLLKWVDMQPEIKASIKYFVMLEVEESTEVVVNTKSKSDIMKITRSFC